MRDVALGHWLYFAWNLPSAVIALGALTLAVAMARALRRNAYTHREAALRWKILGWSAILASITSAIVWPYLGAASAIRVEANGDWQVTNYLGVPLAHVSAAEVRTLRGVDLGGLGWGLGHLEIHRSDGSVIRSVRITRATFDEVRRELGYPESMVHTLGADEVIGPHGMLASGPSRVACVGARF
jgi:hypothetical protein